MGASGSASAHAASSKPSKVVTGQTAFYEAAGNSRATCPFASGAEAPQQKATSVCNSSGHHASTSLEGGISTGETVPLQHLWRRPIVALMYQLGPRPHESRAPSHRRFLKNNRKCTNVRCLSLTGTTYPIEHDAGIDDRKGVPYRQSEHSIKITTCLGLMLNSRRSIKICRARPQCIWK
jgi:hypothetical protein